MSRFYQERLAMFKQPWTKETRGGATGSSSASYRACLDEFRVDVFVGRRCCYLQDDLYDAAREVLDQDELSQRLLQQRLQMPFPSACVEDMSRCFLAGSPGFQEN